MKKIFAIIMAGIMVFTVTGCRKPLGKPESTASGSKTSTVSKLPASAGSTGESESSAESQTVAGNNSKASSSKKETDKPADQQGGKNNPETPVNPTVTEEVVGELSYSNPIKDNYYYYGSYADKAIYKKNLESNANPVKLFTGISAYYDVQVLGSRVYFTEWYPAKTEIKSMNLDGTDVKTLFTLEKIVTIYAVTKKWMLLSDNGGKGSVGLIVKRDGSGAKYLTNGGYFVGISGKYAYTTESNMYRGQESNERFDFTKDTSSLESVPYTVENWAFVAGVYGDVAAVYNKKGLADYSYINFQTNTEFMLGTGDRGRLHGRLGAKLFYFDQTTSLYKFYDMNSGADIVVQNITYNHNVAVVQDAESKILLFCDRTGNIGDFKMNIYLVNTDGTTKFIFYHNS